MSVTDKVQLMDSGSALFKAESADAALEKVKSVLQEGGGSVCEEGGVLLLDFSTRRYWQCICARVCPTGIPGTFAAEFRAGDGARLLPLDLPSRAVVRRMEAVLKALA
ncbi:MAG: hypothetical protein J6Y31_05535 [Bacteroidales bacterium]|nr:hypothetical protein [Bacteroidales bacterium]MBP5374359.1 hypothetical protein [Bacteroidales bacterium]